MHNIKNRLLSLVLAFCMMLAVGLPLASTWDLLTVKAADTTPTNIVLGKQFVATSSYGSGFDETCLTNGVMNESVGWLPTFQKGLASVGDPVDLTMDLGATYTISSATFGAMINASNIFPGTVHVQYSPDADGTTWITVASMNEQLICTGADTGTGIKTLDFAAVQARRIRIRVTAPSGAWTTDKLDGVNDYITGAWACFSEVQIMGYQTPDEELASPAIANIAAGKTAYCTSTVNESWLPVKLTNGSLADGWLTGFAAAAQASPETPVDVAINLEDMFTVSAVSIYPAAGLINVMPRTIVLEYSPDSQGGNWKTLDTMTDVWCSYNDGHGPITFELAESVNARRVRVRGIAPSGVDNGAGGQFLGYGEIEVYGVPTPDAEVTPDAENYNVSAGNVPTCVNSLESNGFGIRYITDGWNFGGPITDLIQNFGWYAASEAITEANPTYITFNLSGFREVSSMVIYPNLFNGWGASVLPSAFEIQLSDDGEVWKTVRKVVDPWSSRYWPIATVYDFEPTVACMARLKITGASGAGATGIGEIEVIGGPKLESGGIESVTDYGYSFVSAAATTTTSTYRPGATTSGTQYYHVNKITVASGVKVNSISAWVQNTNTSGSATVIFAVAPWNSDVYTSMGSSSASAAAFKQTLTVAAGFAGMVTIDIPDSVNMSGGTYLYGFCNSNNSKLTIGCNSGASAADGTNITYETSYYGRVRSSGKNGTNSTSYNILSYVTYEKAAGEKLVLPAKYTKMTEGKAHVILLAGQSNATGNTRNADLSADLQTKYAAGFENILISYNRDNYETDNVVFEPVKLGQGRDSTLFGPEVGLADYLNTNFPGEKFYIIKAAYSGTNLYNQWDVYDDVTKDADGSTPQGWYWFLFTLEVQEALNALVAQGLDPEIFSMLWMQGESDSVTDVGGTIDDFRSYFTNEKNLFDRIQKRFAGYASPNGIAVLDAGIYEGGTHYNVANNVWDFSAMVNVQKRQHAALSQNYYFLDTNATDIDPRDQNSDLAHYDGDDMIELGQLFGQGVGTIIENAGAKLAKGDDNVTRGKEVVTNSSYEDGSRFGASFLTDGRYNEIDGSIIWSRYQAAGGYAGGQIHRTGWMALSSLFGGADASVADPYTLTIDLGDYYEIRTLKVHPGNPESTFREDFSLLPPAYQLQVWNGVEWVTVAAETNAYCPPVTGEHMTYTLETPVTGSAVRMVITRVSDTSTITIVGEIEAFGQAAPDYVPPSDAPVENPNVAFGKPVSSNNSYESGVWSAATLTDGSQDGGWHNGNYLDQSVEPFSPSNPTRVAIDFRGTYEITQVIIKPTASYNPVNSFIPQNFDIQVSSNGQNWTTIKSIVGAYCPYGSGEFLVYDLETPVVAKMIRLNITGNSHNGMYNAIGEIEVMGTKAENAKIDPVLPNVALDKNVASDNSMESENFSSNYLTDGVKFDTTHVQKGWHTQYHGTSSVEKPNYITIDLGRKYKISAVALAPNTNYGADFSSIPRDFNIQVSVDGKLWVTVAEVKNAFCTLSSGTMVTYDFVEVDAVLVRLEITKDSNVDLTDAGDYASALGEIEVYGEIYKTTIPDTELLPEAGQAGLDSGIVRDETQPKKYVTLRFDDCTDQDEAIIDILKKYSVYGATFYLNTGLYGVEWDWVTEMTGASHIRFTKDQLADIYTGFDIGVHGKEHLSLKGMSTSAIISEVQNNVTDIQNLTFFGKTPVGMAYAGGESEIDARVLNILMSDTTVRYGMGVTSTYNFALPESFMNWMPTASFNEAGTDALIDQFIQTKATTDMVLTLWGHGYEFDQFDSWDRLETMIAKLAAAAAEEGSEIVFVTNAQFYQLFKNQIPSMPIQVDDANESKVIDVEITGDGYDIYQTQSGHKGYRYGAQYLYEGNTIHAYFSAPGTGYIDEWDWIAYRRSDDGGVSWTAEKMVLAPSMNSTENFSVCDPSVVKAGDYYYIAYTSTLNSVAMCNNVYVARSKNPDGPFDKWTGDGWGGVNPEPIFYYDGSKDYYGIGEPAMVVKGNVLYLYYTYIGSNDLTQDFCMVATADLTSENWPANIVERGVATRKANGWFASDSLDVKYVEDYGKFIALGTGNRFTTSSELAVWESTDGLNFTLVDVMRQYTYVGLHNAAISSRVDGHINLAEDADKLCVIYAYDGVGKGNQSAEGSTWGNWATRVQPISIGLSIGNNMRYELRQDAMPEGAPGNTNASTAITMIRVSATRTTSTANPVIMEDSYAVKVGNTTRAYTYSLAYNTSKKDTVWTLQTSTGSWGVSVGDSNIATATLSSGTITITGKATGVTYFDVTYGNHVTRAWIVVTNDTPSSSTVLSVKPLRDEYSMYWGEKDSLDMTIRVGVTYTDLSYEESGVEDGAVAATFSGYDESIITIDANGVVTPVGIGETVVTVTCKGVTTTVPVKISLDADDSKLSLAPNATCAHADMTSTVTAPTCTAPGFTTHTCQSVICMYSYIDSYVPALGHTAESSYDPTTGIRTYTTACETCGKQPETFSVRWSDDVALKLDEDLKMYFSAWMDKAVVLPQLVINRAGRIYTIDGTVIQNRGDAIEYSFVFEGITPDHVDTEIVVNLVGDGNTLLTKTFSIQQYIDARKSDRNIAGSELSLFDAIASYKAALEQAKTGSTDGEINISGFTNVVVTDKKVNANGNFATFSYATVGFGNDVRMAFQLVVAEGVNVADLTFKIKVNGGEEIVVAEDMLKVTDNTVMVYTDTIAATEFDDVYTVTVYNGETAGASINYSVKSYVYAFQSATGDSEDQVMLVKALYNYGLSAKAYAEAN